jgi:TolB-like protein
LTFRGLAGKNLWGRVSSHGAVLLGRVWVFGQRGGSMWSAFGMYCVRRHFIKLVFWLFWIYNLEYVFLKKGFIMNNIFKFSVFCIIILSLTNCATTGTGNRVVSLDNAIQLAVENMEQKLDSDNLSNASSRAASVVRDLQSGNMDIDSDNVRGQARASNQKPIITVLDFTSMSNELSTYLIKELSFALSSSTRFVVVDRQRLATIRKEQDFQHSGAVRDDTAVSIGKMLGAQYVITGELQDMKEFYRFQVMALNVETSAVTALISIDIDHNDKQIEFVMDAPEPESESEAFWNEKKNVANRNYLEIASGYVQFGDDLTGGGGSAIVGGHISPFPFVSIGLETRFGGFDNRFSGAASPMAGIVFPFNDTVKLYGDGILELGYFGGLDGLISNRVTPAFDTGILFWYDELGFDIKYRGTWYKDTYTHSVGVGFLAHPEIFFEGAEVVSGGIGGLLSNVFGGIGGFFGDIGEFLSDALPVISVAIGVPALLVGPFIMGAGSSYETAGMITTGAGILLTTIGFTAIIIM